VVLRITCGVWEYEGMSSAEADGESGASADERDLGWGGREWSDARDDCEGTDGRDGADGAGGAEGTAGSGDSEDPDLERLRADRPPHHEERER
jgi:hypothetical protein